MAVDQEEEGTVSARSLPEVRVRRIHRRDLNRTWEFLKLCFRDVGLLSCSSRSRFFFLRSGGGSSRTGRSRPCVPTSQTVSLEV